MSDKIKVLLVEDNPRFAELVKELILGSRNNIYELYTCPSIKCSTEYLDKNKVDIILLDLILPDSQGLDTFKKIKESSCNCPIVIQSGIDDENLALEAVQNGAQDYIIKGEITEYNITRAIRYAIERHKLIEDLKHARQRVSTLSGLVPMCPICKKISEPSGKWTRMEDYIQEHSEADFSQSVCPDCMKERFPEIYEQIKDKL